MADKVRSIGNRAIIGDLETAALVAHDGAIDYLCWPNLDSPTVFAELLDTQNGGAFTIVPVLHEPRHLQLYVPDTNVLMTRWMAEEGSAEIVDLMPHPEALNSAAKVGRCLIRKVTATRGTIVLDVKCSPRFDYARETPRACASGEGICFTGATLSLQIHSSVPLNCSGGDATGQFTLAAGESAWFALGDPEMERPRTQDVEEAIRDTVIRWRAWLSQSTYEGRWREQVHRSALVLKLLTSQTHGSIAAAATFSLPEALGADRNWDYRATWIRDASFTVYAFMRLGFVEEAERFHRWVANRVLESDRNNPLRIMYAIDGGGALDESNLEHLSGYADSRPVRIGNAARHQSQLDIYGELLDSVYLSNKYGGAISHDGWKHIRGLISYVIDHWEEADAGIWEMRSAPRHFLHSRLMCWVSIDRAIRLANKRSLPAPLVEWVKIRDRISDDIWQNFRHPEHGYFVQDRGGTELDAALLMMPLVRFVSANDPVWLATLSAIGEHLSDDGLICRYRGDDGFPSREGAFTTCTFWYVECLARAGQLDEARLMLERGMRYANALGLFSEEIDVRGFQLGNFPQALTHLAFISAAYFTDRSLRPGKRPTWQP